MSEKTFVTCDATGTFAAHTKRGVVTFRNADGDLLTIGTLPAGTWPIAYTEEDASAFLYFTYFLSATLHKWRLDTAMQRQSGLDASIAEIEDLFTCDSAEGSESTEYRQLRAKLDGEMQLCVDRPPTTRTFLMNALDRKVAKLLLSSDLNSLVLANELADLATATDVAFDDVANLLRVPAGYAAPLALHSSTGTVAISATEVMPVIDRSSLPDFTIKLQQLQHEQKAYHSRPLRLAGFAAIEPETILIRVRQPDQMGISKRVDELWLSRKLISGSTVVPHLNRILGSLEVLQSPLAAALDELLIDGTLRLCFADEGAEDPDTISFDRRIGSSSHLIPDLYALIEAKQNVHYRLLAFADFEASFRARRQSLFWRGTTTGDIPGGTLEGLKQNYRVNACLLIKDTFGPRSDAKLSGLAGVRPDELTSAQSYLTAHGIWGDRQPERRFGEFQIYLDLKGNAAAWYTFRKHLMGCLIIRPYSGRELLYYRYQKPWVHFLPAAADLSDLGSLVEWVANNQREAAAIAYAGRRMMIDYIAAANRHVRETVALAVNPLAAS